MGSEDRKRIGYVIAGLLLLVVIYAVNPNNRVYSAHGFLHAGIVYRILNGSVPPTNPLLAGQPLYYSWGYDYLIAWISKLCALSPFYAAAFFNLSWLAVAMIAAYRISRLLINDRQAHILSALVALFGTSLISSPLKDLLPHDARAYPVFKKFTNVTGAGAGIALFLLFLYSVIRMFGNRTGGVLTAALFTFSVLGCGFIYPAFLPVMAASVILVSFAMLFSGGKGERAFNLKRIVLTAALSAFAFALLWPYLAVISPGMLRKTQFICLQRMFDNAGVGLCMAVPLFLVLFINRDLLKGVFKKKAFLTLSLATIAGLILYVATRLPCSIEYKFLIAATLPLGIMGGAAFAVMARRYNRLLVYALLFFFMIPGIETVRGRALRWKEYPNICVEKGTYISHRDPREDELYRWIREETRAESVFIDSKNAIPVFTGRQLFVARDSETPFGKLGYGMILYRSLRSSGYDRKLLRRRKRIVDEIYDPGTQVIDPEKMTFLKSRPGTYIVVRDKALRDRFDPREFEEAFTSSLSDVRVYRIRR
jgi:hypothetical protein